MATLDFGSVPIGGTARGHLLLWNKGGQPGVVEVSVGCGRER